MSSKNLSSKISSYKDDNAVEHHNRQDEIRSSLFPDKDVDLSHVFENTKRVKPFSSMNQLYKPTQKLKFMVLNCSDYMIDTDSAIKIDADLIKLITSSNENDVVKGLEFIHNLCKKQASRLGLASQVKLIDALKKHLYNKNPSNVSHTISSLQHMSKGLEGAKHIFQCDIIPILMDKIRNENKKFMECTISILDNLMFFIPQSREVVRQHKGVVVLVELLKMNNNVKVLTILLDCLYKLTYNHMESKQEILNARGSELTVQFMRQFTYEKLLFSASRLLKVLSVCNANKPVLVETGALEALSSHIRNKNSSLRLQQSCLWSIRNLSDHASHIPDMEKLIETLTNLLNHEDSNVSTCAVGCLCNLTSSNPDNKRTFVEIGGVDKMCQLLCDQISQDDIVEPGAACLRHVTHSHPHANVAVQAIFNSPLLSNLAVLVRDGKQNRDKVLPLIKALVGLIRNLAALSTDCRTPLIELGVVESMCDIFLRTYTGMSELARERNSIVSISSELSYVEGVRLEDLLELSLAALQSLAKENQARKVISYQNNLLNTVVQIVMVREYSPPLHRACLSLLAEMVEFKECARLIEAEGLSSRLSEFINSTNQAIATYAAVIMYMINKDKPYEYRNRIEEELVFSLNKQFQEQQQESNRNSYVSNANSQTGLYQRNDSRVPSVSIANSKSARGNIGQHNQRISQASGSVDLNYPNVPTHPPGYYDNSAFVADHDTGSRVHGNSKYNNGSRYPRKQREVFHDVEL